MSVAGLTELAAAYGVATEYETWAGKRVAVPADTLVTVLGALGVDASSQESVDSALAEARLAPWRRLLPPSAVVRVGQPATVPVRTPEGDPATCWIELEDGSVRRDLHQVASDAAPVAVDGLRITEMAVQIPEDLPLGWHQMHASCAAGAATATLVATPARLEAPTQRPVWGPMVQLYSLRSSRCWGMGELPDLADLVSLCGRDLGAGLTLVNPLHAGQPRTPIEPSPYFPSSRRFADPLYLRVQDIPEFAQLGEADRERVRELGKPLRDSNRSTGLLDRDAVWRAKYAAFQLLFAVPRDDAREAAFVAFREREGRALRDFATWCALAEQYGLPWQEWPAELQDPDTQQVARARQELADRVEFYAWLQWLLDEQLSAAQQSARSAGMPIGVVHDLAVGVSPSGADAWRLGDTLARGVTAGAPPDAFNQQGQDWGQPPWRPDQLAAEGYAPYRDMLRYTLRYGGGLRVDHILGLFRLWWIPHHAPAAEGTYVRYDHEALVGILALEAQRAGAVVVGEDLGTMEPWVRDYLAERGLLGTSMLWFENDDEGKPRAPERWRELCLATVATHDMPPIAGYLAGKHVELRERLGLLTRPAAVERAADEAARQAWLEGLHERGLLPGYAESASGDGSPTEWEIVRALHAFLALTPARLRGMALTDAVGERHAQNQPGTTDEYPNWRIPLTDGDGRAVLLDDLRSQGPAARGLAELASILRRDARTDSAARS